MNASANGFLLFTSQQLLINQGKLVLLIKLTRFSMYLFDLFYFGIIIIELFIIFSATVKLSLIIELFELFQFRCYMLLKIYYFL